MWRRSRFLFTPRWLGLIALAAALCVGCVMLGAWQQGRYEDRAALNERIAGAVEGESADLESVLPKTGVAGPDVEWTRVSATGRFDEGGQVLVRNRPFEGSNGYRVLTPLILDDGEAILIDRGWIAASEQGAQVAPTPPAPPSGTVEIEGYLRDSESERGEPTVVDGALQARSIAVSQLAEHLDLPLLAGYVEAAEAQEGLQTSPPRRLRAWQNFAYAWQWRLFAAMIPVGLVLLARKEARRPTKRAESAPDAGCSATAGSNL